MMLRRNLYVLGLITFTILSSCNKPRRHNGITKIELAFSDGWGGFGTAVKVDSSLTYNFYGKYDSLKRGDFVGKISEGFWDTLNCKFEQLKYKSLDTTYHLINTNISDLSYFELIIYWNGGRKKIIGIPDGHDSLMLALIGLHEKYKHIPLKKSNISVKFDVTYQYPPSYSKSGKVKFLPPLNKN